MHNSIALLLISVLLNMMGVMSSQDIFADDRAGNNDVAQIIPAITLYGMSPRAGQIYSV
jgi:hypothetical protein